MRSSRSLGSGSERRTPDFGRSCPGHSTLFETASERNRGYSLSKIYFVADTVSPIQGRTERCASSRRFASGEAPSILSKAFRRADFMNLRHAPGMASQLTEMTNRSSIRFCSNQVDKKSDKG